MDRQNNLNIRVSDHELSMLRALASDSGLTVSDYLRQYIRRSYSQRFGDKKPAKEKK